MSDYEVTLVNDNMQEFYVRFHGPEDSKWIPEYTLKLPLLSTAIVWAWLL